MAETTPTPFYPKALQPHHPSAKRMGKAISPPACERGVPVYPLRYGITEQPFNVEVFPTLSTPGYPRLSSGKAYGLRVLRPGTYVYLCYFQHERLWTRHYQVTADIRFAHLWWTQEDYDSETPGQHTRPDTLGAKPYLLVPEAAKDSPVYLLVSDTMLTHATLWKVESNTDGLRDKLATAVTPTGGDQQPNTFNASLLAHATPELLRPTLSGVPTYFAWSEISPADTYPEVNRILADLHMALRPRQDIVPLAVALQDPIGMTSELNHLATCAVQAKARFAADHAHHLTSAQLINGYFQQLTGPEHYETRARQQALVRWEDAARFTAQYPEQIQRFDPPIERAVADVRAWVMLSYADKPLNLALSCFDLSQPGNARAYEEAVFQCIGALVHSEAGRAQLTAMVGASPSYSHFWAALTQGNPELLARLKNSLAVSKGMFDVVNNFLEEHAATPATNALLGLLQAVPTAYGADVLVQRLRHILEMRFNATLIEHDVSLGQYLNFSRELQGYQALGPELRARWNLTVDSHVTPEAVHLRMKLYEWVKVGETEYRVLDQAPAERPALPPRRAMPLEGNPLIRSLEQLRGPAGYLFTGLGGVLAVIGMRQAKQAISQELNTVNYVAVLSASFTLIGASIEIAAAGVAFSATKKGNFALSTTAKVYAAKRGVAIFGASGVGLFTISDGIKAFNAADDLNSEQSHLYLEAALAGSALTLTTWAGGKASAASIISMAADAGVVRVLGLTPKGWVIIGLVALGTTIYFSMQADEAAHGPVDIWLKHSIWGLHGQRYTHKQELEAFYHLLYRPRIDADWQQASGYNVGTLSINCLLPGSKLSERFAWDMRVTLAGQPLAPVQGPIVHASATHPVDYRRQYLVSQSATLGAERGWTITMHEDAQVAVEYLYQPNPHEQPDLALSQPDAPDPLIFTAGGWFNDPIAKNKVAPVEPPK